MSAFACDDRARQIRGKLPLHENWKSTSEFIVWVINLQKEKNESELEGLWYLILFNGADIVINCTLCVTSDYSIMRFDS